MIQKIINIYMRLFWSDEKYAREKGLKIGENYSIANRYFGTEPYLIEIGDHI